MINKRQTKATVKKDCHLKNELREKLFSQVVEQFTAKGLIIKESDSRFNDNSSADFHKNKERKRNSDAHQTHKGNAWYFGF